MADGRMTSHFFEFPQLIPLQGNNSFLTPNNQDFTGIKGR